MSSLIMNAKSLSTFLSRPLAAALAAPVAAVSLLAAPAVLADNAKYATNCLVCHGADLKGVDQLGVSLVESKFVAGKSEAELVEFLKVGRLPDDPNMLTGRPMPGFSWIAEEELREIAAYVKSQTAQ
jgi:mono/diheme cytochrome c family protein